MTLDCDKTPRLGVHQIQTGSGQISSEFSDPGRIQCIGIQFGSGSQAGSGKYWPNVHNYNMKHHSVF